MLYLLIMKGFKNTLLAALTATSISGEPAKAIPTSADKLDMATYSYSHIEKGYISEEMKKTSDTIGAKQYLLQHIKKETSDAISKEPLLIMHKDAEAVMQELYDLITTARNIYNSFAAMIKNKTGIVSKDDFKRLGEDFDARFKRALEDGAPTLCTINENLGKDICNQE